MGEREDKIQDYKRGEEAGRNNKLLRRKRVKR